MIDEELVCYLHFIEGLTVSQIAEKTSSSPRHVRDEIVYCWFHDTMKVNALRYQRTHKKELEWI